MNLRRMMATAIWGSVLSLSLIDFFVGSSISMFVAAECTKDHVETEYTSCTSEDACWKDFISKSIDPIKFKGVAKADATDAKKFEVAPEFVASFKAKDAQKNKDKCDGKFESTALGPNDLKVTATTCEAEKAIKVTITGENYETAIALTCKAGGIKGGIDCYVWIIIIAVVLIGGGVAAFFLLGGGGGAPAEDADDDEEEDDENV